MDISLNSSAILVIIVGLWLVWVVPYFLRRQESPAMQDLALAQALPAVNSPSLTEDISSQGNIMENTSHPTPSTKPVAGSPKTKSAGNNDDGAKPASTPAPAFKIRYGRTALALVAVAALLTAAVGTVLSLVGLVPVYLPVLSFLIALASVVALRTMAVRERSKRSAQRVDAAFRNAMNPGTNRTHGSVRAAPAAPRTAPKGAGAKGAGPQGAGPKPATKVFDAESGPADGGKAETSASTSTGSGQARTGVAQTGTETGQKGPQAGQAQLTAGELRKAALAVAAESGEKPAEESKPTWQPVEVPKPKYVESAKADRPAPEPLDLPAEPKPEGKPSIKAGAVAPKVEVKGNQDKKIATEKVQSNQEAKAEGGKPSTGLNNLDDVLQRRRA